MNKTKLLEQMHAGRAEFEAVLQKVRFDQMELPFDGEWTVKDLLAHVGFWERYGATRLAALLAGETPLAIPDEATVHALNAEVYAANRARSVFQVRRDEEEAYRDILALVERMAEGDLFDPARFAWTNGQPAADWVKMETYEHFAEHLPSLTAWVDAGS